MRAVILSGVWRRTLRQTQSKDPEEAGYSSAFTDFAREYHLKLQTGSDK
jgi:hypothetical protein